MRLIMGFIMPLLFSSSLCAATPFNLHGVTKLSVHVADYSDLFDEKIKPKLEKMMKERLAKLGVDTKGYFHDSFILYMNSQKVGNIQLLNVELMISGDVMALGKKDVTFGITYRLRDSIEIEDKEVDVVESLAFLLDEFTEQYIEDNEE